MESTPRIDSNILSHVLGGKRPMPLPTPNSGESRQTFVSRCMGDAAMRSEYPDQKQRAAVAYSQFRRKLARHVKRLRKK